MTGFLELLKVQRWDDHRYYHHSRVNQSLHLLSAVSFVCAYMLMFKDPAIAALIGWLVSMTSRQIGHLVFEPKTYDIVNQATHEYKEEIKVGYNLRRKIVLMTIWALSPLLLVIDPTMFGTCAQPPTDAMAVRPPRRLSVAGDRRRRAAVPDRAAVHDQGSCRPGWSGRPRSSPTRSTTSSSTIAAPAVAAARRPGLHDTWTDGDEHGCDR